MSRSARARLALPLAALSLLVGCGEAADEAATAQCGEVEHVVDAGHHHLSGDGEAPVPYTTTPPTSGWHHRGRDRISEALRVHEEPLAEELQVSVLAVDGVVVSHSGLDDDERSELERHVERFSQPVVATPYAELDDGQVALTAWAALQVCEGVDLGSVDAFVEEHAAEEPDYDMNADDPGGHDH